jgi:hypothetical protein
VVARVPAGHVLAIDRSATAIAQARRACGAELAAGRLELRHVAVEEIHLLTGEAPYDLAFAVRVGALDGRHPAAGARAQARLAAVLTPAGRLFVDGGDPLREVVVGRP